MRHATGSHKNITQKDTKDSGYSFLSMYYTYKRVE